MSEEQDGASAPEAPPPIQLKSVDPETLETFGRPPMQQAVAEVPDLTPPATKAAHLDAEAAKLAATAEEMATGGQRLEQQLKTASVEEAHRAESGGQGIVPQWALIPDDPFRFPKGRKVVFIRMRAYLTDVPGKGERQCILWPLSVGDVEFAASRSHGNAARFEQELAKQSIRAIDGKAVDWTVESIGTSANVFWREIGQAYRVQIVRLNNMLNSMNPKETVDFLEHCVSLVVVG